MAKSVRCLVEGKVQGVWFRAWTREQAQKLGVRGWVRNLPDGRVEALLQGEDDILDRMREQLQVGPPHARVDSLDCSVVENEERYDSFDIAY